MIRIQKFLITSCIPLALIGCFPISPGAEKQIKECMDKGRTPTYIKTFQMTMFRCDMPGTSFSLNEELEP